MKVKIECACGSVIETEVARYYPFSGVKQLLRDTGDIVQAAFLLQSEQPRLLCTKCGKNYFIIYRDVDQSYSPGE